MTIKTEELTELEKKTRKKYLVGMVKYSLELKKIGICDALLQLVKDELVSNDELEKEIIVIRNIFDWYLKKGTIEEYLTINFPESYKEYRTMTLNKNFLDELNVKVAKGEIKKEQLQEIINRYDGKL